jgi:hypothetical protein
MKYYNQYKSCKYFLIETPTNSLSLRELLLYSRIDDERIFFKLYRRYLSTYHIENDNLFLQTFENWFFNHSQLKMEYLLQLSYYFGLRINYNDFLKNHLMITNHYNASSFIVMCRLLNKYCDIAKHFIINLYYDFISIKQITNNEYYIKNLTLSKKICL